MTAEFFCLCCDALFGPDWSVGQVSTAFDVHIRTIRRWISGTAPIPETLWDEIRSALVDKSAFVSQIMAGLDASRGIKK